MMKEAVYIAGVGAITSVGTSVLEILRATEMEKDGIGEITLLETRFKNEIPVAEVKLVNQELADLAGVSPDLGRSVLLSLVAAKEALRDAQIKDVASLRFGFVSSNTVGQMDKTDEFFNDFVKDRRKGRLRNVYDHECGGVTQAVADLLGIKHLVTTINTACSSSANAIVYGARLLRNNVVDVVVAGGTDAITKYTLNGFVTLMLADRNACKPFDQFRSGLNLGEGAGYVVMVSERILSHLGKPPYCILSGYNNSNDAFHHTASSTDGTGAYLAMKKALSKAGLNPEDIDYVNLHGTGTENNDSTEGAALKRLFAGKHPPVSSTKSFTGHTLGAAGGIEAVFSVMAIRDGVIFPNLRFETQMTDVPFSPEKHFVGRQKIRHVMSNSFGFGGNCTSLIFSKI